MSPRLIAALGLAVSVLLYGGQFVTARHALLNGLTAWDMTALRFGVAGVVLLPLFIRQGWRDCAGLGWWRGIALVVTSGAPLVVIMNVALGFSPAAHGAAIQPGFVMLGSTLASAWLAGERLGLARGIALAIAFSGLLTIGLSSATTYGVMTVVGDTMFVVSGSGFAAFSIMCQRWRIAPLVAASVVSVVSLPFLPIYFLALSPQLGNAPLWVIVAHGINQGLLVVVFGVTAWAYGVRELGLERVAWFSPMIPVCGLLMAIPMLNEWPSAWQLVGVTLVVGGLCGLALSRRNAHRR